MTIMFRVFAIVLTAIVATYPASAGAATHSDDSILYPESGRKAEPSNPASPEFHVTAIGNGMKRVALTGRMARAHVEKQKQRRPEAFATARNKMVAAGWHPTDNVVVLIDTPEPVATKLQSLSDSVSDSGGQLILEYYAGGTATTWQGTWYAENFATGEIKIWDNQIETADPTFPTLRSTMIYREGPFVKDPVGAVAPKWGIETDGAQDKEIMDEFTSCVINCCAGMAAGCIASGIGWGPCFVIGCFGACHVSCAITTIFF